MNDMILNVIDSISVVGEVDVDELLSESRKRILVICRHLVYYYLHIECQWPLMKIGKFFNRNHASIYHGIQQAYDMLHMACYKDEQDLYNSFLTELKENENRNIGNCDSDGSADSDDSVSIHSVDDTDGKP